MGRSLNNMAEDLIKPVKKPRDYIFAVGRRRDAIARVRLYKTIRDNMTFGNITVKKGDVLVNGKNISEYFSTISSKSVFELPLVLTNTLNKYTLTIQVNGGGNSGQLGATVLGISRALIKLDPSHRTTLKKKGLLERDPRTRQRRKVGMGGKSRRSKQSPKR